MSQERGQETDSPRPNQEPSATGSTESERGADDADRPEWAPETAGPAFSRGGYTVDRPEPGHGQPPQGDETGRERA